MAARTRQFLLHLDPDERKPLYLRVVEAVVTAIRQGRLKPGEALPGTRVVAKALGVNRNTLLTAYRELEAEGWVDSRERAQTAVARRPPLDRNPEGLAAMGLAEIDPVLFLGPGTERALPGVWDLRDGIPDVRLLAVETLGRAYGRALRRHAPALLGEEVPQGHEGLRSGLARLLSERRGLSVQAEHIVLARGHAALAALAARTLVPTGGRILVEEPGSPRLWKALRHAGFELHPIPVDRGGIQVDQLPEGPDHGIRLICLHSFAQFPTGANLGAERRARLLAWAHRHQAVILEDDLAWGMALEGAPPPALAAEDRQGRTILLGGFSQVLAPGVRTSFLAGPPGLMTQVARLQAALGGGGDLVLESALAELIEDGEIHRHLLRIQAAYRARREAACAALAEHLGGLLRIEPATGGLGLWAPVAEGLDLPSWLHRARHAGVLLHPDTRYTLGGRPAGALRIGFAGLRPEEFREAAERLLRALPEG